MSIHRRVPVHCFCTVVYWTHECLQVDFRHGLSDGVLTSRFLRLPIPFPRPPVCAFSICLAHQTTRDSWSSDESSTNMSLHEGPLEPIESGSAAPSEDSRSHGSGGYPSYIVAWFIFISNVDDLLSSLLKALWEQSRESSSTSSSTTTSVFVWCDSKRETGQQQLHMTFGDFLQAFFFPCGQQKVKEKTE